MMEGKPIQGAANSLTGFLSMFGPGDEAMDLLKLGAMGAMGAKRAMPMGEASRMARAKELGYSDEPFYRGQKDTPTEGAVAFYSRDPETAAGFGKPLEYRLQMNRPLRFGEDVTVQDFYDAAKGVEAVAGPDAARKMLDAVPLQGDWDLARLANIVEKHGDVKLMPGAALHQMMEIAAGDAVAPLRAAGFDAIDTGRDVRMLKNFGQRLKEAAFDPDKRDSRKLLAGIGAGGLAVGLGATAVPSEH